MVMSKECEECKVRFNFNQKDIKNELDTDKRHQETKEHCVKRGKVGGIITNGRSPRVKFTRIYHLVKIKRFFVVCKACGNKNFIKDVDLDSPIKVITEYDTVDYVDVNNEYTDFGGLI